jgi:hypothetical protein
MPVDLPTEVEQALTTAYPPSSPSAKGTHTHAVQRRMPKLMPEVPVVHATTASKMAVGVTRISIAASIQI